MSERRKIADGLLIMAAVFCVLVISTVSYFGCYFAVSTSGKSTRAAVVAGGAFVEVREYRTFEPGWLRHAFWPAAKVEAWSRGNRSLDDYENGYEFGP